MSRHRFLVKVFELSSRPAAFVGPNALKPAALRSSTIAGGDRRIRADHDEIHFVRFTEIDHRRMVGDIDRDAFGIVGDAGIARRAPQFGQQRGRGDLPCQSVFAAAGTEQEDVHDMSQMWEPKASRSHDRRRKGIATAVWICYSLALIGAEAAMISCSIATWRAKAPRPAAVAVTVVCGFLPTKAFSTAT